MSMSNFAFDFQALSPVSDNDDWLLGQKSEFVPDLSTSIKEEQDSTYNDFQQFLSDEYTSMITSNQNNSPSDSLLDYKIDLNVVNNRLQNFTQIDEFEEADSEASPASRSSSVSSNSSGSRKVRKPKTRAPRKKLTNTQKAAHNIIEKKYRININTKIESLQKLIPEVASECTGFKTQNTASVGSDTKSKRLNKSLILDKAIEYITFLQIHQSKMMAENNSLKDELMKVEGNDRL